MAEPQVAASFQASPARHYVTDAEGLERPAHFIRLDHLSEDLAPVEDHLGFELGQLPRTNASDRALDYRDYYTQNTRNAVQQMCQEDIARFGYSF
ncbi:MAG: hypothetical protein AAGP08_15370 [Pseudomonadota bacterium]